MGKASTSIVKHNPTPILDYLNLFFTLQAVRDIEDGKYVLALCYLKLYQQWEICLT